MHHFLLLASLFATTPPPYESILVPVAVERVNGINGSVWTTELWVTNDGGEPAAIAALPCSVGVTVLCNDQILIPAHRTRRLPSTQNGHFPGLLLLVSTVQAAKVSFSLHVRDLSQQGEAWGTEIPVVPSRDFFRAAKTFTGIAGGTDYRQTLRLYTLEQSARLRVQLYEVLDNEDRLLRDEVVTLKHPSPAPPGSVSTFLAQATISDLFAVPANRLRLTVTPLDPISWWGFLSVTNNRTQHVTTVTAQ